MKVERILGGAIMACLLAAAAAYGQWPETKTLRIPRLADGKPDLSAPVPRGADGHPDLSGVWDVGNMTYFQDLASGTKPGEVQLTPWATGVQKQRRDRAHVDDPYGYCLPLGVPRIDTRSPFKILQTPGLTVMLHESFVGMMFRQVFTDGRPLPKASEVLPTWLGYSIGRWEADTFVVESTGFRDRGWLSANMAYPNSDALHVIERFRRTNVGNMDLIITIDDPKAFVKPWTNTIPLKLLPDAELIEAFCDNQMLRIEHFNFPTMPPEPPSPSLPGEK